MRESGGRRIGTLIVDDDDDLRLLVRLAIEERNEGLFVSGEAADGLSALARVGELAPDVVVLDQMMPGLDGIETATRMLATRPRQRIVLFTAFLDDELARRAEAAGIRACLPKNRLPAVAELVFMVASGET